MDGGGFLSKSFITHLIYFFLIYLQGKSPILVFILAGVAVVAVAAAAAAVVGVFVYQKRNGERIKLSRRTNTCLHLPLLPVPFYHQTTSGLVVETSPPLNDEPPPISTVTVWH